ncbi:MAG: hypothetical protein JSR33_03175 [Proteobacteria bacterium]|nr:hypothetical protein [Pseudomonadota bacterium]
MHKSLQELIDSLTCFSTFLSANKPPQPSFKPSYVQIFPALPISILCSSIEEIEIQLGYVKKHLSKHNSDSFTATLKKSDLSEPYQCELKYYVNNLHALKSAYDHIESIFLNYKQELLAEVSKEKQGQLKDQKETSMSLELLHKNNLEDCELDEQNHNQGHIAYIRDWHNCNEYLYKLVAALNSMLAFLIQEGIIQNLSLANLSYSEFSALKSTIETNIITYFIEGDVDRLRRANVYQLKSIYKKVKKGFSDYHQALIELKKTDLDSLHKTVFEASCRLNLISDLVTDCDDLKTTKLMTQKIADSPLEVSSIPRLLRTCLLKSELSNESHYFIEDIDPYSCLIYKIDNKQEFLADFYPKLLVPERIIFLQDFLTLYLQEDDRPLLPI